MPILSSAHNCAFQFLDYPQNQPVLTGLVSSLTKGTSQQTVDHSLNSSNSFSIDLKKLRLSRLKRSVKTSSRLHQESLASSGFRFRTCMVTLTYRPGSNWKPQHIKEFIRHIRNYLRRLGHSCRYVWVAELQVNRGAVHYHLILWLPRGITLPKPDKRGWWPYGSTRIEWVRKPVSYIAKYASKDISKSGLYFPKGIRLHGCGGLDLADRRERSYWSLPKYIREHCKDFRETGVCSRAPGGGFVSPDGVWHPSKYKILTYNPLVILEK